MSLVRGGEQGLDETVHRRDTGETEGLCNQCNCSWQGSLHGGVGGGTTR